MPQAIETDETSETAVDILVTQRRTHIGTWKIGAVIRELAGSSVRDDLDNLAH